MSAQIPRGAAPHKSAYAIEKELKKSLETTDAALKEFLLSLQRSGMQEGIAGYRALQVLLVQQRLWAQTHGRTQVAPLFRSIAKAAGELHGIFSAYAEAMRPLKDLDRLRGAPPPDAVPVLGAEGGPGWGSNPNLPDGSTP